MKPRDNNPAVDFFTDAQGRRRPIPGGNNLPTASQPKKAAKPAEKSYDFKPLFHELNVKVHKMSLQMGEPFARYLFNHEPLTVTSKALKSFVELATALKIEETRHKKDPQHQKGLNSVIAVQILAERAVKETRNNPQQFIKLMNEILLGQDAQPLFLEPMQNSRIDFGGWGMHPMYQDGSSMQMYHFWAYVNYGFKYHKDVSKFFNYGHELLEPPLARKFPWIKGLSKTGSKADYLLSGVGYNLGKALATGQLKPSQLAQKLPIILGTTRYRPFDDEQIPENLR